MDLESQAGFLSHLKNLRARIIQTIIALREFETTHASLSWPELLSQLNVITAKFASLQSDMNKDVLSKLVVQPRKAPTEFPEFLPRVLLRTKLIPEVEASLTSTATSDRVNSFIARHTAVESHTRKRRKIEGPKDDGDEQVERALAAFDETVRRDLDSYLRILGRRELTMRHDSAKHLAEAQEKEKKMREDMKRVLTTISRGSSP